MIATNLEIIGKLAIEAEAARAKRYAQKRNRSYYYNQYADEHDAPYVYGWKGSEQEPDAKLDAAHDAYMAACKALKSAQGKLRRAIAKATA